MPVINKSPQAFVDLDELASYIQRDNPDAAHRFLISAEWTFNLLAAMPHLGKEYNHPSHQNLRVWYVRRPFRNYKILKAGYLLFGFCIRPETSQLNWTIEITATEQLAATMVVPKCSYSR